MQLNKKNVNKLKDNTGTLIYQKTIKIIAVK